MTTFKPFPFIPIALTASFLYWLYLASTAQMVIAHDAHGYEYLGRLIYEHGFGEYLRTGPNREPLYPLLVAFAMLVGGKLSISYQAIQIFLQMLLLFLTQILILKILKKLSVNNFLSACAVLYVGISPAMVNSVFRLYSEILTYPLVLGVVYLISHSEKQFLRRPPRRFAAQAAGLGRISTDQDRLFAPAGLRMTKLACFLGIGFVLLTFVKGIFEAITPLFLLTLFILYKSRRNNVTPATRPETPEGRVRKAGTQPNRVWIPAYAGMTSFVLISLFTFLVPITAYKLANKAYNGHFTLTDRGSYALYGNTTRRVEKISPRQISAAAAFAVSWRYCQKYFTADECTYWSYTTSDQIGFSKSEELHRRLSPQEADRALIKLSAQKVFENPLQYALLFSIEGLKMLFWESPSMQYVYYPQPIINLYTYKPINRALYVVMPILTLLALIFTTAHLSCPQKRASRLDPRFRRNDNSNLLLPTIMIFIACYIFMHSFFLILDRYSFPIVPLYLILIAFSLQQIFIKKSARQS